MPSDEQELAQLGSDVVKNGQLVSIRDRFRLSTTMLAHMIGVAPGRLLLWLHNGYDPSRKSAIKIGNWYERATSKIAELEVGSADLVHVSTASQQLGASYATITDWCTRGLLRCQDLGVLGLYVHKDDIAGPSVPERG